MWIANLYESGNSINDSLKFYLLLFSLFIMHFFYIFYINKIKIFIHASLRSIRHQIKDAYNLIIIFNIIFLWFVE